MAGEQERTTSGPGNFQREQVDASTRPGRPGLGAERTQQQHAPLFLPGQGTLPLSTYTEDTQAFHAPPVAQPQLPASSVRPALTRKLPPALAATAVQPPLQPGTASHSPFTSRKRDRRLLWLAGGMVFIVLLAVLALVLSSLVVSREHPVQEPTASSTSTSQATSVGSTPVAVNGFTVIPTRFTAASCAVDNGYRCTAMLSSPPSQQATVNWTAYGTGVATKFSPASGTIASGQQQQVIIYVYTPCHNSGQFVFLLDNASIKLEAPWSC